jgi:hypothetical protein
VLHNTPVRCKLLTLQRVADNSQVPIVIAGAVYVADVTVIRKVDLFTLQVCCPV